MIGMNMKKVVNMKFNQGIDSMVRVLNYLRRKEIEIEAVSMEKINSKEVNASITFNESISEEKILSHLKKLYDVKSIEFVK